MPRTGLDLPERRPYARYRLARRNRTRRGLGPGRGLVSGGRMAVAHRRWGVSETLWRDFTAIDLATAAYVVVATIVVLFAFRSEGIPGWPWLLTAHALMAALVLLPPRARNAGRVCRFFCDWFSVG